MLHIVLYVFLLTLALTGRANAARSEYILGGKGNPWPVALDEDAGFYVVFGDDGQPVDSVSVTTAPRWTGADTLLNYSNSSMQPVWIDPSWNLARIADWNPNNGKDQVPLYTFGNIRVQMGENTTWIYDHLPVLLLSHDGDPKTANFRTFTQYEGSPPGVGRGWRQNMIVNFGADLPINRIRFYPRLSRVEDRHIIEAMAEPKPVLEDFGEESFKDNYIEWYEIGVADNTAPFADDPAVIPRGKVWHREISHGGTVGFMKPNDPNLTVLRTVTENLDVVVDYRFPMRHVRWVALRALNPVRNWETAEIEIYGEGYVRKAVYLTDILDFGQLVSWGKIRWAGQVPSGTRVEIRTRTGNDPRPENYWHPEPITGEMKPITLDEYEKIPVGSRQLPTYDADNWSYWSPPYDFEAGQRDSTRPAAAWEDGVPLQSPSPSRYIQIHMVLYTARNAAPRLDGLELQFARTPSASRVVGEIWPIEVASFEPQNFTYVVQPEFQEQDAGFDRLEILTHTAVDSVHFVKVAGAEIDLDVFPPEIRSDRLVVKLDRKLQGVEDRLKRVEVNFDVAVLRFGAEFSGWVFDSADPDQLKQRIEPGNATLRHAGNVLSVRTRVGGDLLVFVEPSPNPFTPNGDGINDELSLSFKVREVAVRRAMQVQIFDLRGRLVHTSTDQMIRSGEHVSKWDGRNERGEQVAPGIYIYQIKLETDEKTEEKVGTIAVAY